MVPVVLVGLEAKPEDGQIRLPKLDSRYPAPVPRPTGNTLGQLISLDDSELGLPETICRQQTCC